MRTENIILTHGLCNQCVFGEEGYYNAICAHCKYCSYSKDDVRFMTRETYEMLERLKNNEYGDTSE